MDNAELVSAESSFRLNENWFNSLAAEGPPIHYILTCATKFRQELNFTTWIEIGTDWRWEMEFPAISYNQ